MPLKLTLKPNEKLIVNGAVLSNGSPRAVTLTFDKKAQLLQQKGVLLPEDATTPLLRTYFALQCMYLDHDEMETHPKQFIAFYNELLAATRNVSNAHPAGYIKKTDSQTVGTLGQVQQGPVLRNVNEFLLKSLRDTTGTQNQLQTTVTLLSQLESAFGTPSANTSLSAKITSLQNAFQDLSINPEQSSLYNKVIDAANGVTRTLHQLTQTVTSTGADAQQHLNQPGTTVNQTFTSLNEVNNQIVAHTGRDDVTDLQDQRDRLLSTLSGLMDSTTLSKPPDAARAYSPDAKQ